MKAAKELCLIFSWLVVTNGCDPQEQKFIRSLPGAKYLIWSLDQEYFLQLGSSNFTVNHLMKYLNFTTEKPHYPFIICTTAFDISGRFEKSDETLCSKQKYNSSVVLSYRNHEDEENLSLMFYGCDMKKNHLKILIMYIASNFSISLAESFWENTSKINRTKHLQHCECKKSSKYVRDCLKGDKTQTETKVINGNLYIFAIVGLVFAFIAGIFTFITRENQVGVTN